MFQAPAGFRKPASGGRRKAEPGVKSEGSLHWHVAHILEKHLSPPAWFTTFPAGGGGEFRGKILKGMGLKSGVPDILIICPIAYMQDRGDGLLCEIRSPMLYWIELKKAGKGKISEAQIATQATLAGMGCRIANCENLDQVRAALCEWQLPYRAQTPQQDRMSNSLRKSFADLPIT